MSAFAGKVIMTTNKFCFRPLVAAIAASLSLSCAMTAVAHGANGADSQPDVGVLQSATPQQAPSSQTGDQQQSAAELGAVVVHGVRASQRRSIQIKRLAPNIQDSITAENIGQLPDVTITDSLSRITGVQISRNAGEGSTVSVRGLPQVGTTLNGEAFITAGQIVSQQPNFTTVPAELFSGADVKKSATASQLVGGITGTINLRTRRPWDMDTGWTFAGTVSETHGSITDKYEPQVSALASFNDGGRWGALLSVAYSDVTHGNIGSGNDAQGGNIFGENADSALESHGFLGAFGGRPIPSAIHQLGGGNVDVNGDGDADDAFYGSEAAYGNQSTQRRKRLGINASLQFDLGSGFTATADGFFTRMENYNYDNMFELFSASYRGSEFVPVVFNDTGRQVTPSQGFNKNSKQDFYTTTVYRKWPGDIETLARNTFSHSVSRNFNLQLNYDNGGPFTGSVRGLRGAASKRLVESYVQFSLSDGTQWPNDPYNAAPPGTYIYPDALGGNRVFNPNGLAPNSVPIVYDMRGTDMSVTLPPGIQDFLNDPDNYALKSISSDNNYTRKTGMTVFRADGHYDFGSVSFLDDFKLDFGVRNSIRTASNTNFHLIAPVYAGMGASDPNGCYIRWKAADVVMNGAGVPGNCTAGNAQGYFRGGMLSAQSPSELPALLKDHFVKYNELGNVHGISIFNLDPTVMQNPRAFQEALYPGEKRNPIPGGTWALTLKSTTAYIQADFFGMIGSVPWSGNLGVKVIRTNLHDVQHRSGQRPPYGVAAPDIGLQVTEREWTDVLPALNLQFNLTPKLALRLAASKNMQPLNLNRWGGGLSIGYDIDTSDPTSTRFVVTSASSDGNPMLDPWRSTNYGASLEYYFSPGSIVSLAAFYINVESFIKNGSVLNCTLPDLDGTVSGRCVPVIGPIQGKGRSLHGAEFDYKQAFTFLPGLLSHTGIEANFTYSPSDSGEVDLAGNTIPFQQNSEKTANLVLWYQDDRFQFRIAENYRSRRAVSENFSGIEGLELYQAPTMYVDASFSYKINKHVQLFLQGTNITGEHERYYLTWPEQVAHTIHFDRRYMLGVRANF